MNKNLRSRTILFDYPIDTGGDFLDETHFAGMVVSDSVSS
jgi:hypothetical protein